RPEIVAGRENVRASEFGVNFARKTNLPSFDLSLAAGTRNNSGLFANPTATLGLTVTWLFADGGATRGRTESARANETTARANLIRAGQLVVSEVGQAYLALANALQRVTLADVGVANAEEGLRLAEGRYRGGVGTFLEITDAQAALFTAQQRAETTRGDLSRARANLRRAIGEPIEIPRAPANSNAFPAPTSTPVPPSPTSVGEGLPPR
ncbi:TolC family protein, partial [bacterium]